jgi:hypothetical protein
MNTFILVIIIVSVIHFIYDGIVMPSLRLGVRYRLFALRDEIRCLKCEHAESFSDDVFKNIDEGISFNIANLHNINFYVVAETNRLVRNSDQLRSLVAKRIKLIEDCPVMEVKEAERKVSKYIINTVLIN